MKGKLIKGKTGYWLDDINGNLIASVTFKGVSDWKDKFLLSLKNCQAIENGYDLDELYEKVVNSDFSDKYEDGVHYYSFTEGFQKALEILCDKKFSEKDVINAFHVGRLYQGREGDTTIENYLQSLQQTEWDVEIVTELAYCKKGEPGCKVYDQTKNSKDIFNLIYHCDGQIEGRFIHREHTGLKPTCVGYSKPMLDKDGCLILKRI